MEAKVKGDGGAAVSGLGVSLRSGRGTCCVRAIQFLIVFCEQTAPLLKGDTSREGPAAWDKALILSISGDDTRSNLCCNVSTDEVAGREEAEGLQRPLSPCCGPACWWLSSLPFLLSLPRSVSLSHA